MKTPMKVSIKVRRTIGTLSRMRSRMSITFKCIFSREGHLWFFLQKGNVIFVTFIHIYRKCHISMPFLRKIIFYFLSKEKISYFPKKNNKKDHILAQFFLEIPSFRGIWRKYHISMYFEKDHRSFTI